MQGTLPMLGRAQGWSGVVDPLCVDTSNQDLGAKFWARPIQDTSENGRKSKRITQSYQLLWSDELEVFAIQCIFISNVYTLFLLWVEWMWPFRKSYLMVTVVFESWPLTPVAKRQHQTLDFFWTSRDVYCMLYTLYYTTSMVWCILYIIDVVYYLQCGICVAT